MSDKPLLELCGIITVLNTPFSAGGEVDLPALRRHVAYALDAGVAGFLAPAMASEVGKLSEAERDALVKAVLEAAQGRAVVIGGASAATLDARLDAVRRMIDLGCDGVLVSFPYDDDAQYRREVEAVAALDPPFLMIQDWDFTGYGVPVPLIVQLFTDIPCFRCLKVEVAPAGPKYTEVLEATGGRLHVSGGWAVMQMIEALDRGVHAFMPTALHRTYVEICRLHKAGNREAAQTLFRRLLPVLAFANQHLDISIHFFKRFVHAQGIYETPRVREPIAPFDAFHERTASGLIALGLQLEEELAGKGAQAPKN